MIGIPLGLLYANGGEWLIHRYVLHGMGKRQNSFWRFHWHTHHRNARRNEHYDADYDTLGLRWNGRTKELLGLVGLAALHAPLFPLMPFFTSTLWYASYNYYRVHKRSHQDPAWAKQHLPWHVDHHMGANQNANWCVTRPWFDHLMGTRVMGTPVVSV